MPSLRFPVLGELLMPMLARRKLSLQHVAVHLRSMQDWNKQIVSLSLASFNRPTTQEKPWAHVLEALLILRMPASQMPPFLVPSCSCLVQDGGNSKLCSPFLNCLLPTNPGSNPSKAQLGKSTPRSQGSETALLCSDKATAARGGQAGDSWRLWGGFVYYSARGPFGQEDRLSGWTLRPKDTYMSILHAENSCKRRIYGPVRL